MINAERCMHGPSCTVRVISTTSNDRPSSKKFFWTKSLGKEHTVNLPVRDTDGRVFSDGNVRVCAPKLVNDFLIWGPFEKAYSLWDVLVEASSERLLFEMIPTFKELGAWLRSLHSKEVREHSFVEHRYDEECSSCWNAAAEEAEKRNMGIPECPSYRHKSLIHGSLGLSSLNYDTGLSVFGWEKFGVGDPVFDVSFLLSELLEMYCAFDEDKSQALVSLAEAFCDSYYEHNGASWGERVAITNSVMRKAAIHLVMFGFFFAEWSVAAEQLSKVKRSSREFLVAVGVGL